MDECCEPKRTVKAFCPECGKLGKPVQKITLESLVRNAGKIQKEPYWFCETPVCRMVYFSFEGVSRFHEKDLKVRVGIKETEDPVPLCYCIGWDRKRIRDEIKATGKSTAVVSITKEVKAGNCFCERSNPQGTCCLGNVSKAVKEGMKTLMALAAVALIFNSVPQGLAHEPVFSLGPETIYKGGIGIEVEGEFDKADEEREAAMNYELLYGVTENLSLTLKVPHLIEGKEGASTSNGLEDITLRGKYQFFRKDTLGAQDKAAFIYGMKFPAGSEDKRPATGSGSLDHLFGLTVGHESTTLYGFMSARYLLRTQSGVREKGDQVLVDIAVGFRPWLRPYKSWDLVLLWENSYIFSAKDEVDDLKVANSRGHEILSGPTFLCSIRNLMIKGGIQFPLWQDLQGDQQERDFRALLAAEYHF